MLQSADGGGNNSLGDPPALLAAGEKLRTFANAVTGIAQTPILQSGGEFEHEMLAAADATVGADTTPFQTSMGSLSRAFLEVLIAAAPQLADAAVDLFDSADAFAAADTAIPANAKPHGNSSWIVPESNSPYATFYYRDREGHVVVREHVANPTALPGPAPSPTQNPGPPPTPAPTPTAQPGR